LKENVLRLLWPGVQYGRLAFSFGGGDSQVGPKVVIYQLTMEFSDDGPSRIRQDIPTGITVEQVDAMIAVLRKGKTDSAKILIDRSGSI